jgi:diadenosine tetraphosphate (Ap4A) HIT family hydrolase
MFFLTTTIYYQNKRDFKMNINAPFLPIEGLKVDLPRIDNCDFCLGFPEELTPIAQTPNFYVYLDSSPLVMGHTMIVSKSHLGCAGEVPEEQVVELVELKNFVTSWVESTFGECVLYEHGRAGHCVVSHDGKNKCEHFHLHVLPTNNDVSGTMVNDGYKPMTMDNYAQITSLYERHGSYLYFENTKRKPLFFIAPDEKVESHYIRSLLAKSLDHPEAADWESFRNTQSRKEAFDKMAHKMGFSV